MRKRRPIVQRILAPMRRPGRFASDERGAVAVEFAFLAPPFFALIFAILETSITFFAGEILDSAVHDASRMVRTGQAQTATASTPAWSTVEFRDAICSRLYGLLDCANVKIRVEVVTTFDDAVFGPPIEEDCTAAGDPEVCDWTIVESYSPGVGSDIVMVQAHYKWPTIIDVPWLGAAALADGTRLFSAVRVFKNEPF